MTEIVDISWPRCLGAFDEESCRYFLHEVGSRLVPKYPFSFGMEEVYGIILEKYGSNYTPDVTSLLQELLEDTQNAAGLGDDGDVWRSWRHGWRHRNDNVRSPFIPRFGSLVLRQSTSPRIRLLKAKNYVQQFDPREKSEAKSVRSATSGRTTVVPGGCLEDGENPLRGHSMEISKSCQFDRQKTPGERRDDKVVSETTNLFNPSIDCSKPVHGRVSSATTGYPTLSTLFEMLENGYAQPAQLRGGEQIDERPSSVEAQSVDNMILSLNTDMYPASKSLVPFAAEGILDISRTNVEKDLAGTSSSSVVEETFDNRENVLYGGEELGHSESGGGGGAVEEVARVTASPEFNAPQSEFATEDKRRAENRKARLIDGTIFTPKSRWSKIAGTGNSSLPLASVVLDKKLSARLSWSPGKCRESLRSSWTHEIRQIFHRCKPEKPSFESHKHRSVPSPLRFNRLCHASSMSKTTVQHPEQPSKEVLRQKHSSFGLDGTTETPPCTSPLNLNKPLPLSPEDIVRSMSSRSLLTTSQYSENNSQLHSATSTASSLSRTSSRKDFRGTTRELLQAEMFTNHELPPIDEVDINKDSVAPKKSPVLPSSPGWYMNLASRNPYIERNPLRSPNKPPPLDLTGARHNIEPRTASPTTSQVREDHDSIPLQQAQADNYFPSLPWSVSGRINQHPKVEQPDRGRTRPDPASPTQAHKENLAPKTPTKRSRSPIRRFLGLTKSNSTNKLEDHDSSAPPITPGASKKDSLKKWGDKLRYGFLTPDQEQLRQEELIEAHNNNDSASSTPQNSSFPISLEPPVQAKIHSEVELILTVTANRYLLHEARAGRISAESVAKTKDLWEKLNRPQVVEFHYDQLTQHNLVMANLDRVRLHGDAATDAIAINSTMRGWKTMAREMSIRTFCSPDSVIRKHLHDAHRVLELIGAPLVTFLAYEDMQLKTLSKINQRQKERIDRRAGSAGRNVSTTSTASVVAAQHRRNVSEGSYQHDHDYSDYPITALQMDKISLSPSPTPLSKSKVRKATGGEGAIMSLPTNFERSRDAYAANLKAMKMGKTLK